MAASITKAIQASTLQNCQAKNFSPNINVSYWVVTNVQLENLSSNATVSIAGYYDQAGYDTQGFRPIANMQITIPAADVAAAIATDASLGAYLVGLAQFSGGTVGVAG
jgi:hypothetical protein